MTSWYDVITDEEEQRKLWKHMLLLLGINTKKCPGFRTVVRVNLCCLNSALFLMGTWLVFYLMVVFIFCSVVSGTASVLQIKL